MFISTLARNAFILLQHAGERSIFFNWGCKQKPFLTKTKNTITSNLDLCWPCGEHFLIKLALKLDQPPAGNGPNSPAQGGKRRAGPQRSRNRARVCRHCHATACQPDRQYNKTPTLGSDLACASLSQPCGRSLLHGAERARPVAHKRGVAACGAWRRGFRVPDLPPLLAWRALLPRSSPITVLLMQICGVNPPMRKAPTQRVCGSRAAVERRLRHRRSHAMPAVRRSEGRA